MSGLAVLCLHSLPRVRQMTGKADALPARELSKLEVEEVGPMSVSQSVSAPREMCSHRYGNVRK